MVDSLNLYNKYTNQKFTYPEKIAQDFEKQGITKDGIYQLDKFEEGYQDELGRPTLIKQNDTSTYFKYDPTSTTDCYYMFKDIKSDGTMDYGEYTEYNDKGQLYCKGFDYDGKGRDEAFVLSYFPNGDVSALTHYTYNDTGMWKDTVYTYQNNRLEQTIEFDKDSAITSISNHLYDYQGYYTETQVDFMGSKNLLERIFNPKMKDGPDGKVDYSFNAEPYDYLQTLIEE